jgi:hypothetical protein
VPFVVQTAVNLKEFKLVGDAYVHDIMDGGLWRLSIDGNELEGVTGSNLVWEDAVLLI